MVWADVSQSVTPFEAQVTDRQVMANFKSLYIKTVFHKCHEPASGGDGVTLNKFWTTESNILEAVRSIVATWQDVSVRCWNAAWNLSGQQLKRFFEGFEDVVAVDKEVFSLGKSLELETEQDNMEELVQSHKRYITIGNLQDFDGFTEEDRG